MNSSRNIFLLPITTFADSFRVTFVGRSAFTRVPRNSDERMRPAKRCAVRTDVAALQLCLQLAAQHPHAPIDTIVISERRKEKKKKFDKKERRIYRRLEELRKPAASSRDE